jgi:hypothetical protein
LHKADARAVRRRSGRPSHDWPALFREWMTSGQPKGEFLRSKGFAYQGGTVAVNTRHWLANLRNEALALSNQYAASVGNQRVIAEVPKLPCDPEERPNDPLSSPPSATGAAPQEPGWEFVVRHRGEQAVADWLEADAVRAHIAATLEAGWQIRHEQGLGTAEALEGKISKLTAVELKQLASALAVVQRVQRLALGLSTDNVGVDAPYAPVETAAGERRGMPVFAVEMAGGKFVSPRPRRVE